MPDQQGHQANDRGDRPDPASLVLLVDYPPCAAAARWVFDHIGKAQSPPSPEKQTVWRGLDMNGQLTNITQRLRALRALNFRFATNRDTTGMTVALRSLPALVRRSRLGRWWQSGVCPVRRGQ